MRIVALHKRPIRIIINKTHYISYAYVRFKISDILKLEDSYEY